MEKTAEQIKAAAQEYSNLIKHMDKINREACELDFIAGAKWYAAQFHKQETAEPSGQPYFHLSRNEYGKAWLFYKPSKGEVGKYCCWEPIDDEFYMEFEKMQKAARRAVQDTQEKPDSGWISVKERLPEEAKPVWCFESPNHQFSGIYTKGHEIEYENDDEDREFDAEEERRGSLLLKVGWYEEVEQVQATYDFFWMPRNVTHWRPLAGKPE